MQHHSHKDLSPIDTIYALYSRDLPITTPNPTDRPPPQVKNSVVLSVDSDGYKAVSLEADAH